MKPPLTLVNATSLRRKQRQTGDDLVQSILDEYELEAGGVALLRQTGDAVDRLSDIVAQIKTDGLMVSRKTTKRAKPSRQPHPLLKVELSLRAMIARNLAKLGLDLEPVEDGVGRPARGFGITGDED